jgi:putative FmdB family regulatory protein
MPTYEYRCPEGHHFERFAKMSEAAAELPCPECGKMAARQLSGGAGLVFKGSGFYLTDYGKNAHRKGGPEGGKTESPSGESSSDKSTEPKSSETKSAEPKASESKSAESSSAKSSDKRATTNASSSTTKKSDT